MFTITVIFIFMKQNMISLIGRSQPLATNRVVLVTVVPAVVLRRENSSSIESIQGPQQWSVDSMVNLSLLGGSHSSMRWRTVPLSEIQRLSAPTPPMELGSSQAIGFGTPRQKHPWDVISE